MVDLIPHIETHALVFLVCIVGVVIMSLIWIGAFVVMGDWFNVVWLFALFGIASATYMLHIMINSFMELEVMP